jgi:hypothetical protein
VIPRKFASELVNTLRIGGYNLLLGSGVTLDSRDSEGNTLPKSEELRLDLCHLIGADESTPLSLVSNALSDQQRLEALTRRFSKCLPGASLKLLPFYVWSNLFTFNIDDVIENLYFGDINKKQTLKTINYKESLITPKNKGELLAIHLHGWTGKSEDNYVFSNSEYAQVMRDINPWMVVLSQIMQTEPFIIAGTSLNEVDLEFYLSKRNANSPRRGRGPSLYIDPKKDIITEKFCQRFGLLHVSSSFGEFLNWLYKELPTPPRIYDLVVPDKLTLFSKQPSPRSAVDFFSDFQLVQAIDLPNIQEPSGFLFGKEPEWRDLDQHIDIERPDNGELIGKIKRMLADNSKDKSRVLVISDEAGVGKTTTIKRVAHDLAFTGLPILSVYTTSRIDVQAAKECLKLVSNKVLILVDNMADHVDQIVELLDDSELATKFIVLGSERAYRFRFLDVIFGTRIFNRQRLQKFEDKECRQLLERYRELGLIGNKEAIDFPKKFAHELVGDPVAVSICRIMNNFRPLERIVRDLWNATETDDQLIYLCVALSEHCHKVGVKYSIVQTILGTKGSVNRLFDYTKPLSLTESTLDSEYIVASNSVIAERILEKSAKDTADMLFSAFNKTAAALAPYVNRFTVMKKTPEAKLAGRLFDYDKVVSPLLGGLSDKFYLSAYSKWQWNSRYWEQRALLTSETNLQLAIQHARHAIAIETHPFTLTTYSKLLIREMEEIPERLDAAYYEAFGKLIQAIEIEHSWTRTAIQPFAVLVAGTIKYLELGGVLKESTRNMIKEYSGEAAYKFKYDKDIISKIDHLGALL